MPTNCEPWPGNTTAMRRSPSFNVWSNPFPLHGQPAVDGEHLASDVPGRVGGEEGDGFGDVVRLAEAALWDLRENGFLDLVWQTAGELGGDEPGRDRVDGHAAGGGL